MEKPKAPRLVTVAIFTTITIIFWVFMGLYDIITSAPPVNVNPELLKPINPILDQEALNRLEGRILFEEGQTSSPIIIRDFTETAPEFEADIEISEEDIPIESELMPIFLE